MRLNARAPIVIRGDEITHLDADGYKHLPRAASLPDGKILASSGGAWRPSDLSGVSVSSVFGRTGAVAAQTGDYTAEQVGAAALVHSHAISDVANLQITLDDKLPKNNPAFTGTLTGPAATLSGRLIANGATPLSWGSTYKSVQLGLGSSLAVRNWPGGDAVYLFNNAYRDDAHVNRAAASSSGNCSLFTIRNTGELAFLTGSNPGAGAPATLAEKMAVDANGALALAGTVRVTAGGDGLFANIERVLFTDLGYQWTNNDERSIFANVTDARRRFSANAIVSGMQLRFESILQLGGWANVDDLQLFIGAPGGPTGYPNYLDIISNRALPSSSALQRIEVDITFIGSGSSVIAYIRSRVSPLSSVSGVGIVYECGGTINVDNSVEREIDIRLNPDASMNMASKWNRVSISYPKS